MDIEKCIKGAFNLLSLHNLIIAYGDGLFVFTKKGSLVFAKRNIKNIYKVAVLPANRVIVECCSARKYIVISLDDGKELCSIKQPPMNYSSPKFAVSKDGLFVYDYYFLNAMCHIVRINIAENSVDSFSLQLGLSATYDIMLDDDGTLCLLQGQSEMVGGKKISNYGIRYEYFDHLKGIGSSYYWKDKWHFPNSTTMALFLGNVNTIITNDLCIYDVQSKKTLPLLVDDQPLKLETSFFSCRIFETKYIVLTYKDSNVIIDRATQKIVARYFTESVSGCIVGNEFWCCSAEGILRKKFPFIESDVIKPKRTITW